jgi:hypothetical protein
MRLLDELGALLAARGITLDDLIASGPGYSGRDRPRAVWDRGRR